MLYIYYKCSSLVKCYNSGKFLLPLMSMLERHIAYFIKLSKILIAQDFQTLSLSPSFY
jgi:hypothetical protein